MARWAISGGSGFLGLHLARRLLGDGHEVRTLDLAPRESGGSMSRSGMCADPRACARLCGRVDVLVHAAAALPIRGRADEIRSVNVDGTATLLAAAAEAGVGRVVFISSAVVYGLGMERPVTEATEPAPIEPYGVSKLEAERVCRAFGVRSLETVVLRPSAFVGPERLGVFGILFDWVREGRRVYTLGQGTNRYQLLDVDDLVDAVVLAAEAPVAGETFNVGAAVTGTVAADLDALIAHAGSSSRVTPLPAGTARVVLRGLGLMRLSPLSEWHYRTADRDIVASVEKARRVLGWEPRYSSAGALVRAYDWYLGNGEARCRGGDPPRALGRAGACSREAPVVTPTVLIVAKAPVPGRSKTRLVPPLTPLQAADLHRALLLDTLDACREEIDDVRILLGEPADADALSALVGEGTALVLQEGRGLGNALSRGIATHAARRSGGDGLLGHPRCSGRVAVAEHSPRSTARQMSCSVLPSTGVTG